MAWGNAHESTALAAYLAHSNSMPESAKRGGSITLLQETGLWMLDVHSLPQSILSKCPELTEPEQLLPPIGASPDAMKAELPPPPTGIVDPAAAFAQKDLVWEPVEVKCICPFWEERAGQGGRKRAGFSLNRSVPHGSPTIPVHAAVQIQLQMMACGTSTATMLSYTALHGMHVLRVARDDEWCAMMLRVSRDIYAEYVLKPDAKAPPINAMFGTHAAGTTLCLRVALLQLLCARSLGLSV